MKHTPASKRVGTSAADYKMFVNGEFNTNIPHHFNFFTMKRDKPLPNKKDYLQNIKISE